MIKNVKNIFNFFRGSIKRKLQISYIFIISLMVIPTIYSICFLQFHRKEYDRIITNVSRANRLNQIVKIEIGDEIWNIVAGKKKFEEGEQYKIIGELKTGLTQMNLETDVEQSKQLLEVASRALLTLEKYVNILGKQIDENQPVVKNEAVLEEIRGVAALIYDLLQDFIVAEVETASKTNESLKTTFLVVTLTLTFITCLVFIVALLTWNSVSNNILRSIQDMEYFSSRIALGDLGARATVPNVYELDPLAINLNIMAAKIKQLIDQNVEEQKNLQKAEMKTLQAQITPHFLYNTFDTIIWLAESDRTKEVVEITKAFSEFFRTTISKGHEWITVEKELEHVKNYLKIQKIRYTDILDYKIIADESLYPIPFLKLVLQPLVENAIYHGIKNRRTKGLITVQVKKIYVDSHERICCSVEDNGIGFTKERLELVMKELNQDSTTEQLSAVYGLYSVNKRLQLYFDDSVFLSIKSEHGKGTYIEFTIPIKKA